MIDDIETLYDEFYKLYGDISKLYKLNDNLDDKVTNILKNKTDNFENLKYDIENLKYDIKNIEKGLKNKIDNLSECCYSMGSYEDNIISLQNKYNALEREVQNLKVERENKSSNNYVTFGIAASTFMALFVSAICCGISCSDRVKVEETPTEMRINLDNPQNKDIQLDINHG